MNRVEKALRGLDRWQQRHKATSFAFGVVKKFGDDNAGQLVAGLTHAGFVTLFPLLLVLTTILGFMSAVDPGLRHAVTNAVAGQFPLIGTQLTEHVSTLKRSSLIGLIAGLLVTLRAHPGSRRARCSAGTDLEHTRPGPAWVPAAAGQVRVVPRGPTGRSLASRCSACPASRRR